MFRGVPRRLIATMSIKNGKHATSSSSMVEIGCQPAVVVVVVVVVSSLCHHQVGILIGLANATFRHGAHLPAVLLLLLLLRHPAKGLAGTVVSSQSQQEGRTWGNVLWIGDRPLDVVRIGAATEFSYTAASRRTCLDRGGTTGGGIRLAAATRTVVMVVVECCWCCRAQRCMRRLLLLLLLLAFCSQMRRNVFLG